MSKQAEGERWLGFQITPSDTPQIRLAKADRWHPFRLHPESTGWRAFAPQRPSTLKLEIHGDAGDVAVREWRLDGRLVDLTLPWSLDTRSRVHEVILHVPPAHHAPVILCVFKRMSRRPLLDLCVGRGMEIGAGLAPQVLPGPGVDVRYLDAMPPDQWTQFYGLKEALKPELAPLYDVGQAHDLPVADDSLDFIFSSHVFEHLVNPLGHLEHWARKLRAGGKVVGVIPELGGASDYAAWPSTLAELREEYRAGEMSPSRAHYDRFAESRRKPRLAEQLWAEKRSIHVHFYSRESMAELLEEAVRTLGYRSFALRHTPNHKDFHFVLAK